MGKVLGKKINGITILICTYNGASRLTETFKCLMEQKGDDHINWEVILVDNASTDNPQEVADKIWIHKRVPLRFFHEPRPGKTNAIESGFRLSEYDIVCIIDDDNRVYPDYIVKVYDVMSNHPEVAICGAQGIGDFEAPPPPWFEKYKDAFAIGPQAPKTGYIPVEHGYVYGGGSAIRKSVWFELCDKNFRFLIKDHSMKSAIIRGEDSEMSFAFLLMGYKLWYQDDMLFNHYMPSGRINWKYLKKLFFSFGMSDVLIGFYSFYTENHSKKRKLKQTNYWINMLASMAAIIKSLPGYIYETIFVGEGGYKVLLFIRKKGYLLQLLSLGKHYDSINKEIEYASWRKK
ncbi:MAG: glycosyltransferase family 2 protein [Bacteroidales bacterium]|nr:glycosyltransferase family 2 protein [Bacteroidales bacterium]